MLDQICNKIQKVIPEFPVLNKPTELLEYLGKDWKCNLETNYPQHNLDENTQIFCGKNVIIQPYSLFSGKVILEDNVRIGPFAFIRGPAYIGKNTIIGPYCEIIRSIVMDESVIAHKNVVADSIIGSHVNFSGFCSSCNYPIGRDYITVRYCGESYKYLGKYGATIGNNCQLAAYTLTMPGCYIPEGTLIPTPSIIYGNCRTKPIFS